MHINEFSREFVAIVTCGENNSRNNFYACNLFVDDGHTSNLYRSTPPICTGSTLEKVPGVGGSRTA